MCNSGGLLRVFLVAAILCAGCSQQKSSEPDADSTPAAAANAGSSESLQGAPEAGPIVPTESGLSIKRGIVTLEPERSTFRACDETTALWVLDQTEGVLMQTFAQEGSDATLLYVEAYGERAVAMDDAPEESGGDGVFILEEVLYASPHGEVKGCASPAPEYIVSARGTEPFWAVNVSDEQIVWRQPEEPTEIVMKAQQTQNAEGAVRYRANGEGHEVDVLIDARPCQDAMSGEYFAYSATALLDGREFKGCARVGR